MDNAPKSRIKPHGLCFAPLLLAALFPAPPAAAQSTKQTQALNFVPGSSVKLYQVTGDCDWVQWDATITSKTPTCKPTASKTLTNADVLGDDVPLVFEHNGEMIITFGDTIGAVNYAAWSDITNSFLWNAHDPIAKSTTANASDGLLLNYFLTGTHGTEVSPPPQANGTKVDMAGFDTPSAGVSINGTIYLAVTTGNVELAPGSDDMSSDYSVLTTFDETTQAFTTGRTISALPGGHFVAPSFYLAPAGALGTPPPVSPEPIVVIFGVGQYQASNIYLSIVPSSEFWTGLDQSGNSATRYFSGMSNGQPTWSSSESSAVPVVFDIDPANPTIAHHSVFYSQPLNLWLMTFDGGRNSKSTKGIYFAYAPKPWGPWSQPQLIFNACRDKGLGNFMFYYYSTPATNDCAGLANSSGPSGPTIGSTNDPTTTRGTPYGPAIVGRFTIVSSNTLKLFYLMATWNPYATVLMESDFEILPVSPCDPDGDGVAGVSDVQLLINQAQGLASPVSDLNADGIVNVVDVQDGINWVLNLGCSATAATVSGAARGYRSSTVPARTVSPARARIADIGTRPGRRFLWEAGTVAYGSNNRGEMVGLAWFDGRSAYHAFLLNGAKVTDLGTLGGTESAALAINNSGLIVGWADTNDGQPHAFLWGSGRMMDLNDIVSREEDVVLEEATSIDDAGQISATGSDGRTYRITLPSQFR